MLETRSPRGPRHPSILLMKRIWKVCVGLILMPLPRVWWASEAGMLADRLPGPLPSRCAPRVALLYDCCAPQLDRHGKAAVQSPQMPWDFQVIG